MAIFWGNHTGVATDGRGSFISHPRAGRHRVECPRRDHPSRGELLSKRERIHLLADGGKILRILFPKRLLPRVAELHLDQRVHLRCSVTETVNPFTGETSTFYELVEVVS